MTAAIPDGLMYRAGAVVADICGDAHSDAQLITMLEVDAMAEHIARAILSERNRCATVAEHWEPEEEYMHGDHYQAGLCDAGERIALAIRQPTGE